MCESLKERIRASSCCTTSGLSLEISCLSKGSFTTSNKKTPPSRYRLLGNEQGIPEQGTSGGASGSSFDSGGGVHPLGQNGGDVAAVTFNGKVFPAAMPVLFTQASPPAFDFVV